MKYFFKGFFITFIVFVLLISATILLDLKYNFLPAYITEIWKGSNTDVTMESDIDTSEYKYVSSMGQFEFNQYIDLKVPKEFYIPTDEEVSKKYAVFADTVVISDVNTDIIFQLYNIDVSNTEESMNNARMQIVDNLKLKLSDVNFNTDNSLTINGKYIPIISFMTKYKEQSTYTDIAMFEVNGDMMMFTLNSANDYLLTQNLFASIINTLEIK